MAGDDELLSSLYHLHYRRVLRFAYLLTGGRGAEDVVQEAFLRAFRKWDRSAAPETFRPWVETTILRLHLNALRRATRESAALHRLRGDYRDFHLPEPADDVVKALDVLTPRQRAAVLLRYFEDLPEAEVAARLGCRLGTAKALLHQARQRLQIELKESRG